MINRVMIESRNLMPREASQVKPV